MDKISVGFLRMLKPTSFALCTLLLGAFCSAEERDKGLGPDAFEQGAIQKIIANVAAYASRSPQKAPPFSSTESQTAVDATKDELKDKPAETPNALSEGLQEDSHKTPRDPASSEEKGAESIGYTESEAPVSARMEKRISSENEASLASQKEERKEIGVQTEPQAPSIVPVEPELKLDEPDSPAESVRLKPEAAPSVESTDPRIATDSNVAEEKENIETEPEPQAPPFAAVEPELKLDESDSPAESVRLKPEVPPSVESTDPRIATDSNVAEEKENIETEPEPQAPSIVPVEPELKLDEPDKPAESVRLKPEVPPSVESTDPRIATDSNVAEEKENIETEPEPQAPSIVPVEPELKLDEPDKPAESVRLKPEAAPSVESTAPRIATDSNVAEEKENIETEPEPQAPSIVPVEPKSTEFQLPAGYDPHSVVVEFKPAAPAPSENRVIIEYLPTP